MALHIATPLIRSSSLSARTGRNVWLKIDAMQPAGSFKIRGIGNACEHYKRQGAQGFICSSGGNAGMAAAYAGRMLGIPVTVVVPETTTEQARALIRQEQADLIVHGQSWNEANALAQEILRSNSHCVFIHPFDDPLLWAGHASLVDEIAAEGVEPDLIMLSVGGGGLLCGVVEGLRRNNWQHIPILTVETSGAESFAQSVRTTTHVELDAIRSIATTLGARRVCTQAFELIGQHPIRSTVVSDLTAVQACLSFAQDHRLIVEPACGATLSVAYNPADLLGSAQNVLVIVCGGVLATYPQLQHWAERLSQPQLASRDGSPQLCS